MTSANRSKPPCARLAALRDNPEAWSDCLAGAIDWREYAQGLERAGLMDVKVQTKNEAAAPVNEPYSAIITAHKPGAAVIN